MTEQTLERTISQVLDCSSDNVSFVWHGGECLLMGLEFFERAYELERKYVGTKKVRNTIQTNGTLINKELLEFIAEKKDFYLGFSLDGPAQISDKTRVFPNKKGAFEEIFNGIKMVRDFRTFVGGGAIVVVNKKNIDYLDEIYDFFNKERINIRLNHIIDSSDPEHGISALQYGSAMIHLFDRWIDDSSSINIDPFDQFMGNLMSGSPTCCSYVTSCRNHFISIGPQGDIYPCARFDGLKEYRLGNINGESLREALNSSIHEKLKQRTVDSLKICKSCDYLKICNGGCMHNALLGGNVLGKDPFCAGYKILYRHIETKLHKELEKYEKRSTE
jgi:uncharacterized protein